MPNGDIMDRAIIAKAITLILTEMHQRLDEASRIAKAAEACALAGSVGEGVSVSMDIEQILYEGRSPSGCSFPLESPLPRLAIKLAYPIVPP